MKKYDEILKGERASVTHTLTDKDIERFVELTGDDNKIHSDKKFAERTEFKQPVVHGMLGASFISTLIGTKLPGDGALWVSQTLEFLRPVRVGDTITVIAEVISKNDRMESIELKTEILNQNMQIVTKGISIVKLVEINKVDEPLSKGQNNSLKPKSVLLLGASGGIGRATALKLANEGFDFVLHYNSNKEVVNNLKIQLNKEGIKAICIKADLLDIKQVQSLAETTKRHFPELTALVNCSTVKLPNIKFANLEWDVIQKNLDITIKSIFLLLKEIVPIFETQKYGKIVFLTTQAIEMPSSEWLHYITAKSALKGFAMALAIELAGKGINVNLVSPSMTDTDLVADIPRKIKMLIEAKTPLKRLCKPDDIAEAIAYLVSDKSDFITGETIRVNGGQFMQ